MEFAEWAVSGLERYRAGELPDGEPFYEAVAAKIGGDSRLALFMESGAARDREALLGLVAETAEADPEFEQHLRETSAAAQPASESADDSEDSDDSEGSEGSEESEASEAPDAPAATPFFKSTNGLLAILGVVVLVLALAVGLGVGLSGDNTSLTDTIKGTWNCSLGDGGAADAHGTIVVGAGTWSNVDVTGTWKQSGSVTTVTLPTEQGQSLALTAGGLPSGPGPVDVKIGGQGVRPGITLKGTVSAHAMNLTLGGISAQPLKIACTK